MPARGDFGALRRHIADLRDGFKRRDKLAEQAQRQLERVVSEAFEFQRTPSGQAWQRRKHIYGDYRDYNSLLFDIHSSISYSRHVTPFGFAVKGWTSKYYLEYHVTGTEKMVARRPIPQNLHEFMGRWKPKL